MKRASVVLFICTFALACPWIVCAEDMTGRLGVGGIALAGFPLGQESVKDQTKDVGPIFGGMLRYGVSSHWSVGASYENYDLGHGLRVEPIVLQGIYHF
jgi:hypothetical protein